ncbi:hypothetical protein CC78DRAFT_538779 [Lojkania enalia]|uniref:Uncharacterized protein n=1 Tax=Lojkania enalia TaxID=147567 RepID=A0A9P4ND86_9PLEO|nr:hypothetical protein CC78DRAFT_538779 [Didymosphaeria enalia]
MPRARLPSPLACLQLAFRILALLSSLGCLVTTSYISLNFFRSNPATYIALIWAICLDNAEIIALTSKPGDGIKRMRLCPLISLEVFGLVLFMISFLVTFMIENDPSQSWYENDMTYDAPGWNFKVVQWFLAYSIMGIHFFLILVAYFDGNNPIRLQEMDIAKESFLSTSYFQ